MLLYKKNIQRRITQKLKAKPQTFFAVCRPAFEAISAEEIEKLIQIKATQTAVGGLEFICKQEALWKLHLQALTLNSIRMRIGSFRAGTLGELASKIKDIEWNLYLYKETPFEVESHFSHCRIEDAPLATSIVKREIHSIINRENSLSIEKELNNHPLVIQRLYLLGENNHYTISIDCSGKRFFARGYRRCISEAPLRETTASSLFLAAKSNSYQRLFLPMCGSGTFLLEALSNFARDFKAFLPCESRLFPFMQTPSFRKSAYEHLKKEIKKEVPFHSDSDGWKLQAIVAGDLNPSAVEAAQKNLTEFLSKIKLDSQEIKKSLPSLSITQADFFDLRWWANQKPTPSDLILFNPPYGKRLSTDSPFYKKMTTLLKTTLKEIPVAMIIPQEKRRWLTIDWDKEIPFFNGNIRCLFLIRS